MRTRTAPLLRGQRTLLAHELREQGPLGLALLAAGVVILLGVRFTSGAEPGELRAQLPLIGPGLAAVLLAFPAADLVGRDVSSGLVRTFAAAPIGSVRLLAPRLAVFTLVAVLVTVSFGALEPAHWFGGTAPSGGQLFGFAPLFVFVALAGAWLRSAPAALAAGAFVYCAAWVGLASVSQRFVQEANLAAAARVFAKAFMGSLSFATLVPSGLAALVVVSALRGPRARRATRRFVSACGAALLFAAPPTVSAALETYATIDIAFDDPDTQVEVRTEAGSGRVVLRLHANDGPWTSSWAIDPNTGAHRRLHAWALNEERRFDTSWLAEPLRASGEGIEARLALANGVTTDWIWMRRHSWPGLTSPRDHVVHIGADSTIEVVSLIDGSTTTLRGVPEVDFVQVPYLSTDGRWLALTDWVRFDPTDRDRGFDRVRLVDVLSGEVVQSVDAAGFLGWLSGPQVLAVNHAPNGSVRRAGPRYLALGQHGTEPIPIGENVMRLMQLDDKRFVCTTYDNRVLLLAADGTTLRTLRAPVGG